MSNEKYIPKVGDKVVCWDNTCSDGRLALKGVYTVSKVSRLARTLRVAQMPGLNWNWKRFLPAAQHPKEDAFDLPEDATEVYTQMVIDPLSKYLSDFDKELCQTPNECDHAGRCVNACEALAKISSKSIKGVEFEVVPQKKSKQDNVNLPKHYARFKIEPIRFLMENRADPFQFNIVKYTMRHEEKNGEEDLFKMLRYGIMYIRFLRGDPDWWKAMNPDQIKEFFAKTDAMSSDWEPTKRYFA